MALKIIVTDLDGTLMAPDHMTVTERTKNALLKAHEMGVKIAIATGRTLSVIDNVTNQIPFVDYVIYSNGAVVYDRNNDKNVYTNFVPKDAADKIVDFLEQYPAYYDVFNNGCQHAQADKGDYFKNNGLPSAFIEDYISRLVLHDDIADFVKHNDVEKINLFYFNGEHHDEIKDFLFSIDDIECTSPVAGDIEMTGKNVDKGEALKALCDELGFTSDEVMTFGDADNDIGMLKFAKYGFAMKNADEKCKEVASFIAPSNADDGVAASVEKYVLGE